MINYFRKAFTGYQVKKKTVDGVEVRFYFKGTLGSINPVQKVKECISIAEECLNSETGNNSNKLSNIWQNRSSVIDGLFPSLIAKFKLDGEDFEVKRYVKKLKEKPESIYVLKKGNKEFAMHIRVYDHGNYFSDFKNLIVDNAGMKHSKSSIFVDKEKDIRVKFDIFGHSRMVLWNNEKFLN